MSVPASGRPPGTGPTDAGLGLVGPTAYEALDAALERVIDSVGMPTWHSGGGGGDEPKSRSIDLGAGALDQTARLDFRRGEAKDDWTNATWDGLASKLPKYRARLCQQQDLGITATVPEGKTVNGVASMVVHIA